MSFSVSVIIPTYNRAELVQRAITSVLGQTHLPDEVIVIDDGSTDHTPEVLAQYGETLRVIRQANAGRSAARNAGLQAASGDLVAMLDSDDYLPPDSIACRVEAFERDPELGVVYTDVWLINTEGKRNDRFSVIYPVSYPSGMILGELAQRCFIVLSSVMFRREIAMKHQILFDESIYLAEDYDFWLRMAAVCQFQYIEKPLVYYRIPDKVKFTVANWGLPSESAYAEWNTMKQHEILVQQRVMATPAFHALTKLDRARIYCAHGMKNMVAGNRNEARQFLLNAIRISPGYPVGWGLLGLSVFGRRVFTFMVLLRRCVVRLVNKIKR